MHHFIVFPSSQFTLCGVDRDTVKVDGAGLCPECRKITAYLAQRVGFEMPARYEKKETKAMNIQEVVTKSVKQGASAGVIRAASKKLTRMLGKKFPVILLLPPEVRDLVLCLLIQTAAKYAPELPGIKGADSVATLAFEGILTGATSKMVQELINQAAPLLQEIAKAAPGLLEEGFAK